MDLAKAAPVILLFCGVTSGTFQGQLSLQASPICKWYANPAIPEVQHLIDSFGPKYSHTQFTGHQQKSTARQAVTMSELSLLTNPHDIMGSLYEVAFQIKSINTTSWWYYACKSCKGRTPQEGSKYKCGENLCSGNECEKRHCLSFIGEDTNPSEDMDKEGTEFICFGPTTEELTGIPVDTLVQLGGGVGVHTPIQITRLKGKKIKVRATCTRGSLQKPKPSFKIDNIVSMTMHQDENAQQTEDGPSGETADQAADEAVEAATEDPKVYTQVNLEEEDAIKAINETNASTHRFHTSYLSSQHATLPILCERDTEEQVKPGEVKKQNLRRSFCSRTMLLLTDDDAVI